MLKNWFKKIITFSLALSGIFLMFFPVRVLGSIIEQDEDGFTQLNELIQVMVNITVWILAVSGSAALLAFVVGGVMFLISGGSSDLVARGKSTVKAAIIGLIIVFTSYLIINFVMINIFGFNNQGDFGAWYQAP